MTTDRKGPVREKTGQTELKVASGARGRPTNLAPLPVPPFDIGFCHPPFWRTALAAVCPGSLSSLALAVGLVCALCPAEAEKLTLDSQLFHQLSQECAFYFPTPWRHVSW